MSGEVDWTQEKFINLVPGEDTLRWVYAKDGSGSYGQDAGWVDFVEYFPINYTEVSINEAADNFALNFVTGGNANWMGQTAVSYFDSDAVVSGKIGNNESTFLSTQVVGPCTLSFYWKVSSESVYDKLLFYKDDTLKFYISGEVDWQREILVIQDQDTHTVKWVYRKDGSEAAGSDGGWVDKIEVKYITHVSEKNEKIPDKFYLEILNGKNCIDLHYGVPPYLSSKNLILSLYSVSGRRVFYKMKNGISPGHYRETIGHLKSGVYFIKFQLGEKKILRKVIFMK